MEKRDFIMEQIKQFGRVLGMILAGILRLKEKGKSGEIHRYVENEMMDHLHVSFQNMADLSDDQFVNMIMREIKLPSEGMETLAEIFYELGEIQESDDLQYKYLARSLFIYEYLSEQCQTYSLSWKININYIKDIFNPDR